MTIAEVSRMFEISADTLRYYERIGLLPAASRTCDGIRDNGEKDLGWIAFIKCMRSAGLPTEDVISPQVSASVTSSYVHRGQVPVRSSSPAFYTLSHSFPFRIYFAGIVL